MEYDLNTEINSMRKNLSDLRDNVTMYAAQMGILELVWDSIPALLFIKDRNNRIIKVNNYFCEVLRVKKEDVEFMLCEDLMQNNKLVAKYADNDIEVFATGIPKLNILEPLLDTVIILRTDKFPLHNESGKVDKILGISIILHD